MKKNRYNYGTFGFWFNKLPMSARMKARRNLCKIEGLSLNEKPLTVSTLSGSLSAGFIWKTTPEGNDYWLNVFNEYFS